ncbi:MAG: GNAT family N-acetyltransferase [Saprospiraceae bacterium]
MKLLTPSDFPEALEMFHEPETFKYIAPLANKSDAEYLDFLNLKHQQILDKTGYYWVVRNRINGDFIGGINLTPIPDTGQKQIGWQLKAAYRKQGIAFEAAQLALEFGLNHTNFYPIYAVFHPENIASQRILEKLGFDFLEAFSKAGEPLKKYIFEK